MGCLLLAPSGTQPFTFHSCLGLPRAITTLVANQSRYPQHKNAEAPTPSSSSSSLSPSSLAYCTSVERKTTTESRKLAANKPKVQHRASATQHHVGRRQAVLERSLRAPSRRRLAQTLTGLHGDHDEGLPLHEKVRQGEEPVPALRRRAVPVPLPGEGRGAVGSAETHAVIWLIRLHHARLTSISPTRWTKKTRKGIMASQQQSCDSQPNQKLR